MNNWSQTPPDEAGWYWIYGSMYQGVAKLFCVEVFRNKGGSFSAFVPEMDYEDCISSEGGAFCGAYWMKAEAPCKPNCLIQLPK